MKKRVKFTAHASRMLKERRIAREWVDRTLVSPVQTETKADGTVHYLGTVAEHGGRILRVVVNPKQEPPQVITVFFDRRMGRKT